jgi:hypothetical protein
MNTCYIYTLLSPPPERFVDNKSIPPLLTLPAIGPDAEQWQIAILGDPNEIRAVRISIPDMDGPEISSEVLKRYQRIRMFVLDCIRINYDSTKEYFRNGNDVLYFYNFLHPEVGPDVDLKIQQDVNEYFRVNTEGLKALLASPLQMRTVVHLLADGSDFRLPIQFRFLSFYKIVELHFRITPNKMFSAFIAPFLDRFRELDETVTNNVRS